jgi:uncharacterized protein YegL
MSKKNLKNRIAIVLDRSSSMQSIRNEAIQMFNDQVKAIKKNAKKMKDTTVSLFTFSTVADEPVVFNKPVNDLKEIGMEQYNPQGWTALYDSVGMAIERLSALPEMSDPDCSFLVIVVTDGEENKSQHFSGQRLADHISLLQKAGRWTFTFCGANIDVEKLAQQLHIDKGSTYTFMATPQGMMDNSMVNTRGLKSFFACRAGGQSRVNAFYSDEKKTGDDPDNATVTTTTTTTVKTPKESQS